MQRKLLRVVTRSGKMRGAEEAALLELGEHHVHTHRRLVALARRAYDLLQVADLGDGHLVISKRTQHQERSVTTPVTTPCVLDIARRDHFFGSTVAAQPSFFAKRIVESHDVQAPRLVHEVNKML